jgi:hypothetical protein
MRILNTRGTLRMSNYYPYLSCLRKRKKLAKEENIVKSSFSYIQRKISFNPLQNSVWINVTFVIVFSLALCRPGHFSLLCAASAVIAFCYFVQALKGENEFAVQGSVRVLKELSRDLTDSQIPALAPVILPDIYR